MSGVPKLVYTNLCWMILSVLKLHAVETAQEKWKCNLQDILAEVFRSTTKSSSFSPSSSPPSSSSAAPSPLSSFQYSDNNNDIIPISITAT